MLNKNIYPLIPIEVQKQVSSVILNSKKLLLFGVGEVRMTDDGFGPYISYNIRDLNIDNVLVINGKTDYAERKQEIIDFNPDTILILDTCNSSDPPGTVIFAEEDKFVDWIPISSHVIPIHVFIMELRLALPNLKSYLLGINPEFVDSPPELNPFMPEKYTLEDFDEDPDLPFYEITLTPNIQKAADEVIKFLRNSLHSQKT